MTHILDSSIVEEAKAAAAAAEAARRTMLFQSVRRQELMLGMSTAGASVRQIATALECSPSVVQSCLTRARNRRPKLRARENRVAFELHLAVADKLDEDPSAVIARALTNLDRMLQRDRGPVGIAWLEEWRALLSGDIGKLRKRMLDTDSDAEDLRQMSPFMGVLTPRERLMAVSKGQAIAA